MHRGCLASLVVLAACTVTVPDRDESAVLREFATPLENTGDVERHAGRYVFVDGVLDHQGHVHGVLLLPSKLKIYIPNFHSFAKKAGMPAWDTLVGRRVRVGGNLQAVTTDVPGWDGPSIDIHEFAVWSDGE